MKKILLSLILLVGGKSLSAQDLSNGLLLRYDFNGNANDISGNNMHATVDGATLSIGKDGLTNTAYSFDGVDDLINFPNDDFLKPLLPITYSATFMVNTVPSGTHVIVKNDFSFDTYFGAWLGINADMKLHLSYGAGHPNSTSSSDRRTLSTTDAINVGQWYTVVAIIRGATDMEIWLDCVKQDGNYNGTGPNDDLLYNTSPSTNGGLGIGNIVGSSPYYINGVVDDFRYWNRDLTQEEVELLCPTLSVKENKEETLLKSIYPNPSNGEITLVFGSTKSLNVEVYDVTGKCIFTFSDYSGSELKINDLNQGLYFVKVQNETTQTTQRIIVTNN
ncbi:MAG: T9SS type A sorting domain-containing protein [Bacteroidia bacterium]